MNNRIFTLVCFLGMTTAFSQSKGGKELLVNADFSKGLSGWNIIVTEEYKKIGTKEPAIRKGDQGNEVFASVMNKGAPHYVSINQRQALKNGKVYRLTAEVKVVGSGKGRMTLWSNEAKKNCGLAANFPPEKVWKRDEYYFIAKDIPRAVPTFHVCFAGLSGQFAVRNLSLTLSTKKTLAPQDRALKELPLKGAPKLRSVAEVIVEFKADAAAAEAKYKDQPIVLSEPLISVGPGPDPSRWMFTLASGDAKLIGEKSEFIDLQATSIANNLSAAQSRFAAMQRSPKWASMPAEEKQGHVDATFPILNATAWVSGYRDNALLVGRSEDLVIEYP